MQYINNLIADCHLALNAKPKRKFVLNDLSELDQVQAGIYIIEEVGGEPENTFRAFSDFRNEKTRKCARLNEPSQILYIGSSTKNIKNRMRQHYGDGHAGTYSLHLKYWFGDRHKKITILEYDVAPQILQIIEDAISYDRQPAFGKRGSNNK